MKHYMVYEERQDNVLPPDRPGQYFREYMANAIGQANQQAKQKQDAEEQKRLSTLPMQAVNGQPPPAPTGWTGYQGFMRGDRVYYYNPNDHSVPIVQLSPSGQKLKSFNSLDEVEAAAKQPDPQHDAVKNPPAAPGAAAPGAAAPAAGTAASPGASGAAAPAGAAAAGGDLLKFSHNPQQALQVLRAIGQPLVALKPVIDNLKANGNQNVPAAAAFIKAFDQFYATISNAWKMWSQRNVYAGVAGKQGHQAGLDATGQKSGKGLYRY